MRLLMGDRVDPAPGAGFLLLGRADRTVKVAEKRFSLPEMERVLGTHEFVAEAALLVLEVAGSARVHAVVAASEVGWAVCEAEGRGRFGAVLGKHLGRHFDRVLVPRAWRVVRELPRDAQDKVPEALEADAFVRRLEIPEDLASLEGHFDAFPVVAGVAQLAWVLDAAAAWLGRRPRLRAVEALKFPVPLRPGGSLVLRLERSATGSQLLFRLSDGDRVFGTGRLLLAAPPDEAGAA
jgi:3-hydroxymyristoyl/3-hydroxydecanoyl-(acyl carrier protein) dehydratase